ncbi:MAG: hypothetical protein WAU31_03740 [Candidatus Moraniibacteriota bacterium]|jgi:hypothetical protein
MKEQIKDAVEYWLSSLGQHRHETRNMSLTLGTLHDDDLETLKMPTDWFLDFAPFMFRVIAPKHHAELRTTISYLTELRCRQTDAWAHEHARTAGIDARVKNWIKQNGTAKTV